jgi:hypothetical protein
MEKTMAKRKTKAFAEARANLKEFPLDPAVLDKIKNMPTKDGRPISPQFWFGEDNKSNPVDANYVNHEAAWEAYDAAVNLWELQHPEILAAETAAKRVRYVAEITEPFNAAMAAAHDLRDALAGDGIGKPQEGPTDAFSKTFATFYDALVEWQDAVKNLDEFDGENPQARATKPRGSVSRLDHVREIPGLKSNSAPLA